MNELIKRHFNEASLLEQVYLKKEPTGTLSTDLIEILSNSGLSIAEIKGCLEFTAYRLDFIASLSKRQ